MKEWLKHFFVPHEGNDYHPHLLHTKRAFLYSSVFVAMKAIVIAFVLLVPLEVYVLPDVLAEQEGMLYTLTNEIRLDNGSSPLVSDARLQKSATKKASDMVKKSYFAHTSPDGVGLATWLDDAKYPYNVAGENLAIGFTDPRALVLAWAESPTHFANIIDTDFEDTGIRLATGNYEGVQVVYAVQHFGTEKHFNAKPIEVIPEVVTTFIPETDEEVLVDLESTFGDVLGSKEEPIEVQEEDTMPVVVEDTEGMSVVSMVTEEAEEVPFIDEERSFVRYEEVAENKINLVAFAGINTPHESAEVIIGGEHIFLESSDSYGVLRGEVVIDESVTSYFRAVLMPELRIVLEDGTVIKEALRWESIPEISLTPVEQYTSSKTLLSSFTSLFDVTNGIYFFFILFFVGALLIHIFWELHTQHHHVTVQTLGVILLLMTLVVI
jgi:hypothetical protein